MGDRYETHGIVHGAGTRGLEWVNVVDTQANGRPAVVCSVHRQAEEKEADTRGRAAWIAAVLSEAGGRAPGDPAPHAPSLRGCNIPEGAALRTVAGVVCASAVPDVWSWGIEGDVWTLDMDGRLIVDVAGKPPRHVADCPYGLTFAVAWSHAFTAAADAIAAAVGNILSQGNGGAR